MNSASDVVRGLDLVAMLCPDTERTNVIVIDGEPKSKARPRLGKRGHVYSPSTPDEDALAWQLKARIPKLFGNIAVGAIFFRPNFQRIDTDNMLKIVLDAGTKADLWDDDSQVTALVGVIEFDPERPRTVIVVGEHSSTLDRRKPTRSCEICGQAFDLTHRTSKQRFCSQACRATKYEPRKPRVGQGVGRKGQLPTLCEECKTPVSKRSYRRCRVCWRGARKRGIS